MNTQQLLNIFNFIPKFQPHAIWIISLLTLIGYFVYSLLLKKMFLAKKILVIGTMTLGLVRLLIGVSLSILQGLIWTSNSSSIAIALTPPFTPFSYIFSYVWMHFLKINMFTIIGAIGLFFLLKLLNRIGHDRFFYEEEYWLAALGCLTVGWPNLILYFFISAFLNVMAHIIAMALKKEGRISLLYMWPIAMIITIIFGNKLAILICLIQLKP